METLKTTCQIINRGDYLTSIDLSDAFLHILVHESSRKYLQFEWDGHLFQFKVLPFGLSLSPLVFTKVLRPVLKWARRKGIRLAAYLDDILIVAKDIPTSQRHTQMVLSKLQEVGFLVKASKSSLNPQRQLQHLGFLIDTASMSLNVPKDKIRDLRREASRLINKASTSVRQLASFVGKAQAMTAAVFPARLRTRTLLQLKNQALRRLHNWSATIQLTPSALTELQWWRDQLSQWNGQGFLPTTPQHELFTDASQEGWGIVWNNQTWKGSWSPTEMPRHINYKELLVIWKTVQLPQFQGQVLKLYCDNMTTIAYVNKFGGTNSPALLDLAKRIWDFCLQTDTRLILAYIPTHFNPADSPSRQLTTQLEWRIAPTFFQRLNLMWGPHSLDLFATQTNRQVPQYVSWKWEKAAIATDALSITWQNRGRLYACPPWNLLPLVINKILRERVSTTLITPWWPSAIWFPSLQRHHHVTHLPIPRHQVLPAPGHVTSLLQKNPHWRLSAWSINFDDSR
jgi:hypothetical protein